MERERVNSSNIHSAGHDETGMEVQFHKARHGCTSTKCNCDGGDTFHYEGVPADVYDRFKQSPSPGKFFHSWVREARDPDNNLKYPARKL
jgi:KTSC domain